MPLASPDVQLCLLNLEITRINWVFLPYILAWKLFRQVWVITSFVPHISGILYLLLYVNWVKCHHFKIFCHFYSCFGWEGKPHPSYSILLRRGSPENIFNYSISYFCLCNWPSLDHIIFQTRKYTLLTPKHIKYIQLELIKLDYYGKVFLNNSHSNNSMRETIPFCLI